MAKGTKSGVYRHWAAGEPACEACRRVFQTSRELAHLNGQVRRIVAEGMVPRLVTRKGQFEITGEYPVKSYFDPSIVRLDDQ